MGFIAGYDKLITGLTRGPLQPATLGDVFQPNPFMPDMDAVIGWKIEWESHVRAVHALGETAVSVVSRVVEPDVQKCEGIVEIGQFASDPRALKPDLVIRHTLDWEDDSHHQVRAVVGVMQPQLTYYDREYAEFTTKKNRWDHSASARKRQRLPVAPANLMYSLRGDVTVQGGVDPMMLMTEVGSQVPALGYLANQEIGGTTFRVQTPTQFEAMVDWMLESVAGSPTL